MEKLILLMSGGIDSFISANILKEKYDLVPFYVDYGQLAKYGELKALNKQINLLKLPELQTISINGLSEKIESKLVNSNYKNDFFPGRNNLLLLLASQISNIFDISKIGIGIINSSRSYPDTDIAKLIEYQDMLSLFLNKKIDFVFPVNHLTKRDILLRLFELGNKMDVTYSCQTDKGPICNACNSCNEISSVLDWINFGK